MMFAVAAIAVMIALTFTVVRAIKGPTVFDRLLAGNTVGTLSVILFAIVGFLYDRPYFLEVGLTYGMLNMVSTLAVLKFFRHGDLAYDAEVTADDEGPAA